MGITKFDSGAVRSDDANTTRYDLISPIGLRRLAETYREGAEKYDDHNWRKGMPVTDVYNHVIKHIFQYLAGDRSEDHNAHAAWGLFAIMHYEETRPDLFECLRTVQQDKEGVLETFIEKVVREHNQYPMRRDMPV